MEKNNLIKYGQEIYSKHPTLRPFLSFIKKNFFEKPKFSGWGMTTIHEPPWLNDEGKKFLEINEFIMKNFMFDKKIQGTTSEIMNDLSWRHWNITYAVKHAIKFAKTENYTLVECGVEWGYTAFFALRTISYEIERSKFSMHLYDAWEDMKEEGLLESESWHVNLYKKLDIDLTKKNLSEFSNNIVYHKGHIPDSLNSKPESPESIFYLHIDLNSSKPTLATLEFFYPRLVSGGVIIFDDYGWDQYEDTKNIIELFFEKKSGILMKLPTGQAIYFHK
ncbi:class I SAM-dependent methyltransferase [Nitrosopumilus sp.]|uniref:class I SAM-dependent methyltransferase n=1 Tax=Nitrosopumilus sp. TaxID=2024843 RepID=UPI0034A0517A